MNRLDKEYGSREKISSGGAGAIRQFKERFDEYMDDDFNTPRALSVLFEMVKLCNIEFDSKDIHKAEKLNYALSIIKEMAETLGLDFLIDVPKEISDDDIEFKISARKALKKEKKFTEADHVRKELEDKGIILEDAKDGTTWRRKL
jgi:cysteinyl-tRNA synthetase